MDKGFDLKLLRRIGTDGEYVLHRRFPCENHTLCTHVVQRTGGRTVYDAELRTHMTLDSRCVPFRSTHDAEVGNYECIDPGLLRRLQKCGKLRKLRFPRQGVAGEVYLSALFVRKLNCGGKLFKIKITCGSTHSEAFSRKVNGVSAVVERHFKALHIACRRQKFRLINHSSALR